MPPAFADAPIDVEQPADVSSSHLVGVLSQTHHVTLPVHHRYQPAAHEPYAQVCIPPPRVFLPVVTPDTHADLEAAASALEEERGCALLRAPCGVTRLPECAWEEVALEGAREVCGTVPVGLLQQYVLVLASTVVAVLAALLMIVWTIVRKDKTKEE